MDLMMDTYSSGHCTRNQAFNRSLLPEATKTYQPLPNKIMLDMIYSIAKECGLTLTNEQLGMDLKGQRFFGVCDIEGNDFFDGRIVLQIGFCNSYNKSMSARFCIGGKVFVCSNMAFYSYTDEATGISGMASHPHYVNVKSGICERIKAAFGQIQAFRESQESFYSGLIDHKIDNNKAYGTIVRAAQVGVVKKTNVLTIADEWDRQSVEAEAEGKFEWHEEFMSRDAYSLFNAFTQVEKERLSKNPVQSHIGTMDLTNFFCKEFKLI